MREDRPDDDLAGRRRHGRILGDKSAIVNAQRIREMQPLFNGDQTLVLRSGKTLTLSRTYREKVIALLEKP